MSIEPNFQIAALVDDLRPTRPMRIRDGVAMAGGAGVILILLTLLLLGLRPDVAAGRFQSLFLFANGLFLLVGTSAPAMRRAWGRCRWWITWA